PTPLPGQTAQLNAPGLAVAPPVSQGAELANEFMQTIHAAGHFGEAVEGYARQQEIGEHREDIYQRGLASETAARVLPSILQTYANRDVLFEPGADYSTVSQQLADQQSEGHSDAFRDQMRRAFAAHVPGAIAAQQQQTINQERADLLGKAQT